MPRVRCSPAPKNAGRVAGPGRRGRRVAVAFVTRRLRASRRFGDFPLLAAATMARNSAPDMNLLLRLLWTLIAARFRTRCAVLGPCRTPLRVWPGDLDVLFHVNNGVYLSMLDVARVDLLLRAGAFGRLRARGLYPVVAAETIRFRRSLKLFERFEIETRVIGWDEQAFLLTHSFLRRGEVVAEAIIRSRFLKRGGGKASTAEVLGVLQTPGPSPALPPFVLRWNEYYQAHHGSEPPAATE
jgi:acyl-CoA thioesterase FadM